MTDQLLGAVVIGVDRRGGWAGVEDEAYEIRLRLSTGETVEVRAEADVYEEGDRGASVNAFLEVYVRPA